MPPHTLSLSYDDLPLWSAPFGLTLLDTIRMKTLINVLDIGSGSGFPLLELAERMGKKCMVYGLDPSEEAIRMITEKKEARGIVFAKIVKGIAEEIPFPDEYFGLIVSNNGLNNVTDQAASLAECYRVAEGDAQMVLTMNLPHTMTEFYDVFEEILQSMGMQDEIAAMHAHINEKRKPVDFLKALILDAGFDIKTINVDGFKMKYSDGSAFLNHHLVRVAFMEPWKALLPASMAGPVFNTIEQRLNQIAAEKGELAMSVPYVCFDCMKPKSLKS
ncbi:MAG: methyltransferase domain-containing protein [Bacteroidetes bacterium]|nr:methyltransferase domain-containing protein [Bacteroidota bacterium]